MKKSTIGLAPGTLVYEGGEKNTIVEVLLFGTDKTESRKVKKIEDLNDVEKFKGVCWVQVRGMGNVAKIKELGDRFGVSPLVLEDVLNVYHRPKVEVFDGYEFFTLRKYFLLRNKIKSEQISMIRKGNVLISFQHGTEGLFDDLRDRFSNNRLGRLSKHGAPYLAYAVMDFLVDQYLFVQEYFEEKIEELSLDIHKDYQRKDVRERLYLLRTGLLSFRKAAFPLVDAMDRLVKDSDFMGKDDGMAVYVQDLRDHILHTQDFVRTYAEMLEGLSSFFFSLTADKTNKVMQMLTVITIVFLPLTLLAGIYGMNFKHMPELEWQWSYPMLLLVMLSIAVGIYVFFKKKKWL